MRRIEGPPSSANRFTPNIALMILYGITIVSSAFLLFLVQPIIAKQILPWYGGSAAVWTVCVVFFQSVLLAGYAYAHGLTRRRIRTQAALHIALLLAGLACLPILASPMWKPVAANDPTWRIAVLLTVTVGLPYFLLSSTGPLIQKWVAEDRSMRTHPAGVYRLFALSNVGSLVGLLIYPFVVEPLATLRVQAWGWSAGYAVFTIACAGCAWCIRSRALPQVALDRTGGTVSDDAPRPRPTRYAFWLACAALGSMLLLALTNHITQNIASIPFLWVLPLSLYLLSFVVVFEGRGGRVWYVRRWWQAPAFAAVIAMTWTLSAQRGVLSVYIALPILCIGLFVACVYCHGELASTKPSPAYLTQFYLCLAAGGAIGGLSVALLAPKLFDNYWETPIALVGVCVIGLITLRGQRPMAWMLGAALAVVAATAILLSGGGATFGALRAPLPGASSDWLTAVLIAIAVALFVIATAKRWPIVVVLTGLACTGFYGFRYYRFLSQDTLQASRNFYGALRVKESGAGTGQRRDLLHGVILHGDQYRTDPLRRKATTYYGPGSGIAVALTQLRGDDEPIDVAMIGLGAGTLAAWGRTGDRYSIYELNPAVVEIAHRYFTYLSDSKATIDIVLGDARLSMERELAGGHARPFDVIAVDAFSSDSIPVHLITHEALSVFMRHLKPDGIVAFHVSNRFLRLAPVVAQLADDAHLQAVDVIDYPRDDDYSNSEWVLVTHNQAFLDQDAVRQKITKIEAVRGLPMWTDQYNNLFKILK
ncbi:MAG: fused MFS/spermidine synthase [Burkholderiaceae bacterium]